MNEKKSKRGGMVCSSLLPIVKSLPKSLPVPPTNMYGNVKAVYNNYNNLASQVNNGQLKPGYYTTYTGGENSKIKKTLKKNEKVLQTITSYKKKKENNNKNKK